MMEREADHIGLMLAAQVQLNCDLRNLWLLHSMNGECNAANSYLNHLYSCMKPQLARHILKTYDGQEKSMLLYGVNCATIL